VAAIFSLSFFLEGGGRAYNGRGDETSGVLKRTLLDCPRALRVDVPLVSLHAELLMYALYILVPPSRAAGEVDPRPPNRLGLEIFASAFFSASQTCVRACMEEPAILVFVFSREV
jgi:hypothetical protein